MKKLNILYLQSGGPTSVINSSFYGVIQFFQHNEEIENLYGSRFGLQGLIIDDLVKLKKDEDYGHIITNPGAILGSSRIKLPEDYGDKMYQNTFKNAQKYDLDYILVNGGNDSMDTALRLNNYFKDINHKTRVLGIPKTIDNDLVGMDHSPGYTSSALFIIKAIEDISLDLKSYQKGRVTIVETMGRDAGWLALSSGICKEGLGPDLIYIPEIEFDENKFLEDVNRIYKEKQRVLVVVSEALKDKDGKYLYCNKDNLDAFGHEQLGSVSKELCQLVNKKLHYSTRGIELNLLQRCSTGIRINKDYQDAYDVGKSCLAFALRGLEGKMITINRNEDNTFYISSINLEEVASKLKPVPREYMNEEGNHISEQGLKYLSYLDDDIYHNIDYTYLLGE